jgi:hypothetical protein
MSGFTRTAGRLVTRSGAHKWTPDASPHTNYLLLFKEPPDGKSVRESRLLCPAIGAPYSTLGAARTRPGRPFQDHPRTGGAQYSPPFEGVNGFLERSGTRDGHAGESTLSGLQ